MNARRTEDRQVRRSSDGILDEHQPDWLATQEIVAEAKGETRRFMWFAIIPVVLLAATVALFALSRSGDDTEAGGAALQSQETDGAGDAGSDADRTDADGDGTEAEAGDAAATSAGDGDGTPDESGDGTGDGSGEDEAGVMAVLPAPPTGAPWVDATLTDNLFVLTGTVPSEELKQAIEARAQLSYAPFASSEIEVDPAVGDAAWLPAAPEVVGLLPMITDGTIRLQDDAVTLVGRSPNPEYAGAFQQAVGAITGLPVTADAIEITDLAPPRFVATQAGGEITLEGEIPSEELLQTFLQGAIAIYGEENVTSTMTVDEDTYTSFWNYTVPGVFQLLSSFPGYTFRVEDGLTSGTVQGAVLFAVNSADLPPRSQEALSIPISLLARDAGMTMTIIGHTDDRGPADVNQELSEDRARAVVDFMVQAGVDPARLTAEGRGPDEPIASNDTEEGRALNRRVEVRFE